MAGLPDGPNSVHAAAAGDGERAERRAVIELTRTRTAFIRDHADAMRTLEAGDKKRANASRIELERAIALVRRTDITDTPSGKRMRERLVFAEIPLENMLSFLENGLLF